MNHGVLFKISIFSDMFKFITSLDFCFPAIFILLAVPILQAALYFRTILGLFCLDIHKKLCYYHITQNRHISWQNDFLYKFEKFLGRNVPY